MRSPGINGEGELRGQPANPGSPGKMAITTECGVLVLVPEPQVLIDSSTGTCTRTPSTD